MSFREIIYGMVTGIQNASDIAGYGQYCGTRVNGPLACCRVLRIGGSRHGDDSGNCLEETGNVIINILGCFGKDNAV